MEDDIVTNKDAVLSEFAGVELGDARLARRLEKIVSVLQAQPDASFPNAFGDTAELEGFYRFVENPKVNINKILAPHVRETIVRAARHDVILSVADTSEFGFESVNERKRKGLGRLRKSGQGFLGHLSMAVSADGNREPLGVLAIHPWVRTKETPTAKRQAKKISYKESRKLPREQERWSRSVGRVERLLENKSSVIHVMDSEADDYTGIAHMVGKNRRFVIRLCYDRVLATAPQGGPRTIKDALDGKPIVCRRTVKLSRRGRLPGGGRKRTSARQEREATLAINAGKMVIRRPTSVETGLATTVQLNVVHVWEVDSPPDVDPVEWHLLTTEPIDTEEEILRVVDHYRCRWLVEEYFKALKTGCAYEKRQLESYHTLLNALGLLIPIAWNLLRLRTLSRSQPTLPAERAITETQIAVLQARCPKLMPERSTVQDALLAVARLGGHLKRNGPPGWLVLLRGYERLLVLEEGILLARALPMPTASDAHRRLKSWTNPSKNPDVETVAAQRTPNTMFVRARQHKDAQP